jgi:hypothetical protein
MPGAPSQLNDALLKDWPFGQKGAPLWHMDGPIERLLRLCGQYDRVCLGWTGAGKGIDCPAYHERMEEVDKALGNRWPIIHMMRGTAVANDYPFTSADSTSLAQNGWRYDWQDKQSSLWESGEPDKWRGRRAYADRLESGPVCNSLPRYSGQPRRRRRARGPRLVGDRGFVQFGLW